MKARGFLSQKKVPFRERDLFKRKLSEAEIAALAARLPGGVKGLLSTKSVKYKALGLADKKLTDRQLVRLMAEEPSLLRRPIVDLGDRLVIGFNQKEYEGTFR